MEAHAGALPFPDRATAGRRLAERLTDLAGRDDLLVLALPRGGVPVGFEVARALRAPLAPYLVRKIGAPGNRELALGAVAADGTVVLDRSLVDGLAVGQDYLDAELAAERARIAAGTRQLGRWLALPPLADRTVILVDDGVATGATVAAAIMALRSAGVGHLVLAVPVGQAEVLAALADRVDRVEALAAPRQFLSVGTWYERFDQVSDETVARLLEAAAAERVQDAGRQAGGP